MIDDMDSNVDADTSLSDLDLSRLDNIDVDVNTGQIGVDNNEPSIFPANNLLKKTADNLMRAELLTNENPLRTEKTSELERRENEDNGK